MASFQGSSLCRMETTISRYDDPPVSRESSLCDQSSSPYQQPDSSRNQLFHGDEGRSLKRLPSHSHKSSEDNGECKTHEEDGIERIFALLHEISHVQQFLQEKQSTLNFPTSPLPIEDESHSIQTYDFIQTIGKLLHEINRCYLFHLAENYIGHVVSSSGKCESNVSSYLLAARYLHFSLAALHRVLMLVLERSYHQQFDDDGSACVIMAVEQLAEAVTGAPHTNDRYDSGTVHHIIVNEYRNIFVFCEMLFHALHCRNSSFRVSSFCHFHNTNCPEFSGYQSFIQDLFISRSFLFHHFTWNGKGQVVALLFWLKYFKPESLVVQWKEFSEAFQLEYGTQMNECLEKLRYQLCPQDGISISIKAFLTFATSYESLYAGFREKCPTPTSLIISGYLEADLVQYSPPLVIRSLYKECPKQISCGDQHISLVTSTGKMYTWGKGSFGRLGHGTLEDVYFPTFVAAMERLNVVSVYSGYAFTFAITDDGRVYGCGTGDNGRLGTGDQLERRIPMHIRALEEHFITSVAVGSLHSCFLTKSGRLFACGKFEYCGLGTQEDVLIPQEVNFNGERITQFSVGRGGFHTLALSEHGHLYSWGHNRVGQLGFPNEGTLARSDDGGYFHPTPCRVHDVPNNIKMLAAGWGHSAFITTDGKVYICGRNEEKQLGLRLHDGINDLRRNERGHFFQPKFVHLTNGHLCLANKHVTHIGCGGEFTMMTIEGDSEVIGMGQASNGQLFTTDVQDFDVPSIISYFESDRRKIQQVSCGFKVAAVLVDNNYQPLTLRKICSDTIRQNPELSTYISKDVTIVNEATTDANVGERNHVQLDEGNDVDHYKEIVRSSMC